MSTYTISSLKENRILTPFMESRKESCNLKKSKLKKTVSLNSAYVVTNNTQELKKTSLSSSQSS